MEKQQSRVLPRTGDIWSILWLEQHSCSVCVQTWLWKGLVFVWIHHGHRVALSEVDVLWSSCSMEEHHTYQLPEVKCSSSLSCSSLLLVPLFYFLLEFTNIHILDHIDLMLISSYVRWGFSSFPQPFPASFYTLPNRFIS